MITFWQLIKTTNFLIYKEACVSINRHSYESFEHLFVSYRRFPAIMLVVIIVIFLICYFLCLWTIFIALHNPFCIILTTKGIIKRQILTKVLLVLRNYKYNKTILLLFRCVECILKCLSHKKVNSKCTDRYQ